MERSAFIAELRRPQVPVSRQHLWGRGPSADFYQQPPWILSGEQQLDLCLPADGPASVLKPEPWGLAGGFVLYSAAFCGNSQVIPSFTVFLFGLVISFGRISWVNSSFISFSHFWEQVLFLPALHL